MKLKKAIEIIIFAWLIASVIMLPILIIVSLIAVLIHGI